MDRRGKTEKLPPKPPTEDDLFLIELHEACARALVAWLRASVDTGRSIKSLSLPELMNMSRAIEAKWIQMVSQRQSAAPIAGVYENLLLG